MFAIPSLALLLVAACPEPSAQDPNEVLAHYRLRGKPATITRTDVALEMALHLRRRDRGREACQILVDTMLTLREASRFDLLPTDAEVRAFWERLKGQLRAAGRRPEDFAAVRNTGEKQWLRDLSVQIAQERLVRRELGLGDKEKVSGDMLKLWLSEARKKFDIVVDPDELPVGTAARVNETTVQLIDLGLLLLRTSEDHERERFLRQVAYLAAIEALAADNSVRVMPADLDAAIEKRRRDAGRDPRYRGAKFEDLLEAQGLSVASLRALRVFRAQVMLDKVVLQQFSDQRLTQQLNADRDQMLAKIGPRRRIGMIFVRALEDPNALVTRNFESALQHLQGVRRRIASDGFAATASIESEDGNSKRSGGDAGWHRESSDQLPAEVIKAAFALPLAEVSMPISSKDGCYLVTVLDKEPVPDEAELIQRLRRLRADELSQQLLKDIKLEIVGQDDDGKAAGKGQGLPR